MKLKSIKEKRIFTPSKELNTRTEQISSGDTSQRYIIGMAALYNSPSKLIGEWHEVNGEYNYQEFYEIIEPGAFDEVLRSSDLNVIHNIDHERGKLISRTKAGTLTLI